MRTSSSGSPIKLVVFGVLLVAAIVVMYMTAGINNAGFRTVVQYPNGHIWVKADPGWYLSLFGTTETYPDLITFDYDKADDGESTLNQPGIAVRYQDGGLGTIFGKDRFALPSDQETMLKLHKAFRSSAGLANKLIRPVTEEATNMTAGLMSSEAAYAEQRGTFIQWSQEQIAKGKYLTYLESKQVTNEQGITEWKNVPVIRMTDEGQPQHLSSDLNDYGIILMGHQITDWDFEPKTLLQISTKREATMAIITAKANAERAKQDAITAEEQGKANVMTAKYEQEVEKEKAVVIAERAKQVAVIKATQLVDVAEQAKLEAEQKKFAASEYKEEQILRGEGDGAYKQLVMEADGALAQKLATYRAVNKDYASAIARQKWVPEIQFGSSGNNEAGTSGTGTAAQDLMNMFMTKTAKDLSLDMSITNQASKAAYSNRQ